MAKRTGKVRGIADLIRLDNDMLNREKKILQLLVHELDKLLIVCTTVYSAPWIIRAKSKLYRRALKRQANFEFNPEFAEDDENARWLDDLLEEQEGDTDDLGGESEA